MFWYNFELKYKCNRLKFYLVYVNLKIYDEDIYI